MSAAAGIAAQMNLGVLCLPTLPAALRAWALVTDRLFTILSSVDKWRWQLESRDT